MPDIVQPPAGISHAPIDPGLILPPSVAAARDRANAMIANLNGSTAMTSANGQPTVPAPPPAQPGQPMHMVEGSLAASSSMPTNGEGQPFNLNGTGTAPATPPGVPQQASPAQPQASPAQPQQQGAEGDYERLYRSLKGRWDQEVPQLRQSVQAMVQRSNQLEQLLASMPPPQPGEPADPANPLKDFTPDEIEQWGPDMLEMFARIVDRRASNLAAAQVRPLVEQQHADLRSRCEAYLDANAPQWREINFHPAFMEWAILPDPFSGVTRQHLLQRAFEAGDGPRVVNFFRAFVSEVSADSAAVQPAPFAAPAPPAPAPNGHAGPQPPASNRIALHELAAPSGSGHTAGQGAPPAPVPKRIYRRSEIAQFYSDKNRGRYATPELQAQAVAVEADIFQAQTEGRVVNG